MRIALIDNYDSFTYNLVHIIKQQGVSVDVFRNDQFEMDDLSCYDKLLLSPGPGIPEEAGRLTEVIRYYSGKKPILGICLGHQAIGEVFGCRLINLEEVYHGVSTPIRVISKDPLFEGLSDVIDVGRYHSWSIDKEFVSDVIEITSISEDGEIMSIRHKEYDIRGLQFHPESVLTPTGGIILHNWLYLNRSNPA